MKIKIKLMEMYVNTVMDREEYIVELKKGTGFRGGSKVFNRVVGRQTTLNEFVDLENEPEISLPKNIILETLNIIVKDINSYLYTQR